MFLIHENKIYQEIDIKKLKPEDLMEIIKQATEDKQKEIDKLNKKIEQDESHKKFFEEINKPWTPTPAIAPYKQYPPLINEPYRVGDEPGWLDRNVVWCSTASSGDPITIYEEIGTPKGTFILGNRQTIGK